MRRVYTERVFTGPSDSDLVVTHGADTAATVETMPYAWRDEVEAAASSTHLSLGSGLEENTTRRY